MRTTPKIPKGPKNGNEPEKEDNSRNKDKTIKEDNLKPEANHKFWYDLSLYALYVYSFSDPLSLCFLCNTYMRVE